MFRNYLITALRNIFNRKGYTVLNIFGLAVGLTCCLLIFQYVSYERSFESFNRNAQNIIRLRLDLHDQGKLTMQSASVFPGIAPLMKKEFPEVEKYCRIIDTRISWLKTEMVQNNVVLMNDALDNRSIDNKGYYVDPAFLQMFGLSLITGDLNTALNGPDKIVLSQTEARKYFGDEGAVGKNITVREGGYVYHYQVTGVFKDYPSNSHLSFNYLISYQTFVNLVKTLGAPKWADPENTFSWYDFYDYFQLKPGTDLEQLQKKITGFADRYLNSDESRAHNNREDLYLIPMSDIHLDSHYNEEAGTNGDGRSITFLYMISFLIVVIAWVNYTNLATARSLERAKEVGVRKVLGALRKDLVGQFLTESLFLNLTALLLSFLLVFLTTGFFNSVIGSKTSFLYLPGSYWRTFIVLFFTGAIVSGLYPAFVLSGYHPIAVLKGMFKNSVKGMVIRKSLIVGQFATSIVMIAGTIIVYQQVKFMMNQDLGANINQTLVLDGPSASEDVASKNSSDAFKNDVIQVTGVRNITASSSVMGREIYMSSGGYLESSKEKNPVTFYTLYVDEDFLSSYQMRFAAGRNFSKSITSDRRAVVMNVEAARLFGVDKPANAVNEIVNTYNDSLKVIGVVENYHQLGLSREILPTLFVLKPEANNYYSIKLSTKNPQVAIESIRSVWNKYFPQDPFSHFFLDESFNKQYQSDQQFSRVFGLFALIAIMIACFGLLSLSAYNVLQRTKEIGIRKTLGAPTAGLLFLLSKDFLLLVLIGFIIAIPATWWIMSKWLDNFAFRVPINAWVFLAAGTIAILIALATISVQALKAALRSPVKSLRTE